MARVETVVTGVAGSPYYFVGHFDALSGSADQMVDAWHTFVTGSTDGTSDLLPAGSNADTNGTLNLINPTTGDVVGQLLGTTRSSGGVRTDPKLPPSNQILTHWRTGIYAGGREIRGKTFRSPCYESDSAANGQLDAAVAVGYRSLAIDLIDDANTTFVIWSKKNGQWQPPLSATIWQQFAVLRSRRD